MVTFILNGNCFTTLAPWSSRIFVKGCSYFTVLYLYIAFQHISIYKSKNLEHSDLFSLLGINMSVDMTRPNSLHCTTELSLIFPLQIVACASTCLRTEDKEWVEVADSGQKRRLICILWLFGNHVFLL